MSIEINEPFMKIDQKYLPRNHQIYLSGWYGTYSNYIKYIFYHQIKLLVPFTLLITPKLYAGLNQNDLVASLGVLNATCK